jgi:uncharacterized protein
MLRWLAALWCLALPAVGWGADVVALPTLAARVTDLTATLTAEQLAALEAATAAIEKEKGAQVAILLLPTTQPESIEQFGIRLAEAWRIGRKDVNDGVIVIVAKNDRKMRIEVAYGLEGAIPDALAKRIVDETMAPRFKQGDFAGGLRGAADDLAKLIGGEALPAPVAESAPQQGPGEESMVLLFITVAMSAVLRAMLGVTGSLVAAAVAGWLAWAVFASWLAVAIAAVAAFVFSFARDGSGWHTGGRGGGLGGGGFSSSGGGGGFSGGGGSFGGGGASGDW